ncbi:hypothetical protein BDP27DRAFT_1411641 [Rhodocollybia butyracea]|uniref:Uncharacterized protein n=1 Tax=Rhodocollybia butyracea TaxID=206335 RepID=A0A9P5TUZ2_9AGAR|nr:hypothetical protein BDP27DRAFT_1411641 [Rhodocollybia butyracea]
MIAVAVGSVKTGVPSIFYISGCHTILNLQKVKLASADANSSEPKKDIELTTIENGSTSIWDTRTFQIVEDDTITEPEQDADLSSSLEGGVVRGGRVTSDIIPDYALWNIESAVGVRRHLYASERVNYRVIPERTSKKRRKRMQVLVAQCYLQTKNCFRFSDLSSAAAYKSPSKKELGKRWSGPEWSAEDTASGNWARSD